jgi:hypothetical protein
MRIIVAKAGSIVVGREDLFAALVEKERLLLQNTFEDFLNDGELKDELKGTKSPEDWKDAAQYSLERDANRGDGNIYYESPEEEEENV